MGMNTKRVDFDLSYSNYRITPYWLLGFVEGDGWFSSHPESRDFVLGIIQKNSKAVFEKIQKFLFDLAAQHNLNEQLTNLQNDQANVANIYLSSAGQDLYTLKIKRQIVIEKIIIPLFDVLTWHTNKYLDYCDGKAILNLRNKGFHYLPEGKALIERILNQMNNHRLSTSNSPRVNRTLLIAEIDKFLSLPSNYEIRDGKKFIKSLNRFVRHEQIQEAIGVQIVDLQGNILNTFDSFSKCAKYLGISKTTISNRLKTGKQFSFGEKLVH